MEKIARILSYIFMAGAVIFFILTLVKGDDTIGSDAAVQASILDPFIYLAYILIGLASLLVIFFAVYFLITHPEKVRYSLIGIGTLVLVAGISYVLASGEVTEAMGRMEGGVTGATSRRVGMGLISFYLLAGIAVLAVILSSFKTLARR